MLSASGIPCLRLYRGPSIQYYMPTPEAMSQDERRSMEYKPGIINWPHFDKVLKKFKRQMRLLLIVRIWEATLELLISTTVLLKDKVCFRHVALRYPPPPFSFFLYLGRYAAYISPGPGGYGQRHQ